MPLPQPPKKKRKWVLPVLFAVTLLMGIGAGSVKPAEIREVTKEVPVEKIVTKEVTKNVPVTPAECREALNYAEDALSSAGEVIGLLGDTLSAAMRRDTATIQSNNAKLDEQSAKMKGMTPNYKAAKALCLSK